MNAGFLNAIILPVLTLNDELQMLLHELGRITRIKLFNKRYIFKNNCNNQGQFYYFELIRVIRLNSFNKKKYKPI